MDTENRNHINNAFWKISQIHKKNSNFKAKFLYLLLNYFLHQKLIIFLYFLTKSFHFIVFIFQKWSKYCFIQFLRLHFHANKCVTEISVIICFSFSVPTIQSL